MLDNAAITSKSKSVDRLWKMAAPITITELMRGGLKQHFDTERQKISHYASKLTCIVQWANRSIKDIYRSKNISHINTL